jgi:class 3 adenylate cyclase
MAFEDQMRDQASEILNEEWKLRDGQVVPKTNDVAHKNGAVKLEATFLYADLAGSTQLQKSYLDTFAAKAVRMYLGGASSIIRNYGGSIKSFDGDRVMGVFVGGRMRNDAVRAAFAIHWLVQQVINPLVKDRHESNGTTNVWAATHGIGVDVGETFVARAGVRNKPGEHSHNDLIFIGRAANVAAKLSSYRDAAAGPIIITDDVHKYLDEKQKKYLKSDTQVWSSPKTESVGPHVLKLHRADYWRSPS